MALVAAASATSKSLPGSTIRGVNLVAEPWMMHTEWKRMGCAAHKSEFDCMMGKSDAQAGEHWFAQR